ncbi:hypothetical protein EA473_19485 [Natrarchaeobius chitinivorans]|uniref:Uncharacterized protein n=1 Tax=Natrarchaeobius chitinivorans TaxID=1679083 RepID=A0A3N6P0K7_NATCH|nr:hypothetical protein EA473_19485 [Natrarchaeobius chitinivorans]
MQATDDDGISRAPILHSRLISCRSHRNAVELFPNRLWSDRPFGNRFGRRTFSEIPYSHP